MTAKGWVRFASSAEVEVDLPTTTLSDLSLALAEPPSSESRWSGLAAWRAVVVNDWTVVEELNWLKLELKLNCSSLRPSARFNFANVNLLNNYDHHLWFCIVIELESETSP